MKAHGLTVEVHLKLSGLSTRGESGIPGVEVKFVDIGRNTGGRATSWASTDAHARKRGEQTGLDTPVVRALNDVD